MFDDLIKAIIAKDEARACELAQELDYISYKDIVVALALASKLPEVIEALNEKAFKQINNQDFKKECNEFIKFTLLEKIPESVKNLSFLILSKFVRDDQVEIKPYEYCLLDIYLLSVKDLRTGEESKDYVKSFLTNSETANDILIDNIEKYIIAHPEQTSYGEWVPAMLGQEVI